MLEPGVSDSSGSGSSSGGEGNAWSRTATGIQVAADVKKAAENKILCYHHSLTQGCGNTACTNENCVSSGMLQPMSSDEAAVRALKLFSAHAPVCSTLHPSPQPSNTMSSTSATGTASASVATASDSDNTSLGNFSKHSAAAVASTSSSSSGQLTSKVYKTTNIDSGSDKAGPSTENITILHTEACRSESNLPSSGTPDPVSVIKKELVAKHTPAGKKNKKSSSIDSACDGGLTHELLLFTLETCHAEKSYAKLRMLLWSVFSNDIALKRSYVKKPAAGRIFKVFKIPESQLHPEEDQKMNVDEPVIEPPSDVVMSKEQLRESQSDLDKDIDSSADCNMSCDESSSHMQLENLPKQSASESFTEGMQVDDSQETLPSTAEISLTDNISRVHCSDSTRNASSTTSCSGTIPDGGTSITAIDTTASNNSITAGGSASTSVDARLCDDSSKVSETESRTVAGSDENTKVLGLPLSADGAGKNSAIGYTVLKTTFPEPNVDFVDLHKTYDVLKMLPESEYVNTLLSAQVRLLRDHLAIKFRASKTEFQKDLKIIDIIVILLENPSFISENDYTETLLEPLSEFFTLLGEEQKAILVIYLSKSWTKERLNSFLAAFHHLITIKLITTESGIGAEYDSIQYEKTICAATKSMHLVFVASILAGEVDLPLLRDMPDPGPIFTSLLADSPSSWQPFKPKIPEFDPLCQLLGIHPLDSMTPLIPLSEFYDEFLSDQLEADKDYAFYKSGADKFSFLHHPYILTPATKVLALYYDNRIRMYSERRLSMLRTFTEGLPSTPYLKLRVRRQHIINDALIELEVVAMESPTELRKQLVVEFEGEQGIDEGGVSKEFFQLVTEQLFCPDFGMFSVQQETGLLWFNPHSFESDAQFSLVGLVLGLAIYNNVILDLHLPPVLYKKLCGKPGTFHDLEHWNPTVYRSLLSMLEYEGEDMEDMFVQNFRVGYQDVFGECLWHNLKEDGENIMVAQHNKHEFVSLYSSWLLNSMVKQQFGPFLRGFLMVTEESPLTKLFRPDELELLLCGSQQYDFSELEKSAEYDGGYSSCTPVVEWFWQIVKTMAADDQKQLLQFTTGSPRAPVGGLAHLKLVIARHGTDTDRLPTAHTCFNVLLLPEYVSKDKLQDRLMKAITYSHGFGML